MAKKAVWLFNEPQNQGVISTRSITSDGRPILFVSHDADDGGWQFLDGGEPNVDDGIVVCLSHVLALDSTVGALADLPLGWCAWRETAQSSWKRGQQGEEE